MSTRRPLILVSNDDGIDAPGIHALAAALVPLGEVRVVAPLQEQSAVGHAITMREPVRAHKWPFRGPDGVIPAHAVTGTPADCVKLAIDKLLPRVPDVVVSGINQGPNAAVNVIYSGTVSAATEAAILGIDAVAVSYCRWTGGDFAPSAVWARRIVDQVIHRGLPPGILLNVNVPDRPAHELQGVRVTRQARSRWEESYSERLDPFERPYYWMAGTFVNLDDGDNTDLHAIEQGYVSVTPVQHDLTAHEELRELGTWTWQSEPEKATD
ncbi:MAG: 5'/3'-nucleotidase SurE [Rhodothermales bacterium]|nr:5'/3'-nucleotidase SurE [Rhodothermales bacterium]MBO6779803.1 5'/3'-nucleotidase SurE [Rhodothermales bacterium]